MSDGVEWVMDRGDRPLAVIVRAGATAKPGVEFYTDRDCPLQLGRLLHPTGHIIPPHTHRLVERIVTRTCEALFVRSGRLRVDFYDLDRVEAGSREVGAGDVLVLLWGGHGFTVLEAADVFEIKQGPYAGDMDKVRFEPIVLKPGEYELGG